MPGVRDSNRSPGPTAPRSEAKDDSAPTAKRRRIALACTACRSRKSRCNGTRPKCSLCESLGFDCVYEATESTTNLIVPKDYFEGLSGRLKALEERVDRHDQALAGHATQACQGRPKAPGNQDTWKPDQLRSGSAVDFQDTPISLDDAELQELPPEEHLTDGMAISFLDEEDSGFFGASSNISLMNHISWLTRQVSIPGSLHEADRGDNNAILDSGVISTTRPPSAARGKHGIGATSVEHGSPLALPSEADTRKLVSLYFSNTGLLFPYLHEATFVAEYDRLVANGFKKARRTWLGLLYMVLAMSSSTLIVGSKEERQQRNVESESLYRRAMMLCDRQALRGTNVETVQYLLLMTQYLQGTQMSFQTWTIHGLAIKAAISLGLHSIEASRLLSPLEQETRKRAWYGCIVLDRSLSMAFGRPASIAPEYIRLPLPADLSVYDDAEKAIHRDISVKFFNATITLYETLHRTVAELYGHNLGCDPPLDEGEMLDRIFRLERALSQWECQLPVELTLLEPAEMPFQQPRDPIHQRFRVVLTLRKLNLEVLIHRPALLRTMDSVVGGQNASSASGFAQSMRQKSVRTCVKSAETIIDIIHHLATSKQALSHLLGAWWYSVYYVFNSALIVFGHFVYLQSQTDSIKPIWECNDAIHKVMDALKHLDTGNATIRQCTCHLVRLSKLLQNWSAQNSQSAEALETQQVAQHLPADSSLQQSNLGLDAGLFSDDGSAFDPGMFHGTDLDLSHFCFPSDFPTVFGLEDQPSNPNLPHNNPPH